MTQAILFLEPKGTILEVIESAKARGYRVVSLSADKELLENLPSAYRPLLSRIDVRRSVKSWSDEAELSAIWSDLQKTEKIAGVYSGVDACMLTSARFRSDIGLPTPSSKTMARVLNKRSLRTALLRAGLSKLRTYSSEEVQKWSQWPFEGAAYFKPLHGSFSAHVYRCDSLGDLRSSVAKWKDGVEKEAPFIRDYLKSCYDFHVEESFDGELLSVESIVSQGRVHVLGITSRILFSKNPVVEMGSCFPYPHRNSGSIIDLVEKAHAALEFTDGPTHVEVIVNSAGRAEIIDFNPRFVGADVLQSINNAYGVRMQEALLDFSVGRSPDLKLSIKQYSCLQYVLAPCEMTFQSITFPDAANIPFSTSCIKPGTELKSVDRQLDYLGCYLTVGPSFESALAASRGYREQVRVNDTLRGEY